MNHFSFQYLILIVLRVLRKSAFILFGFSLGLSPVYAAVEYEVVLSTSENYRIKQKLDEHQDIHLRHGEKLRLKKLGVAEYCTLKGIYQGKATCPTLASHLKTWVPSQRSTAQGPTELWAINMEQDGDVCVRNTEKVLLWRRDDSQAQRLSIRPKSSLTTATPAPLVWRYGQQRLYWQAQYLPIQDKQSYLLQMDSKRYVAVTLHVLPEDLKSGSDIVSWMVKQGCKSQIDLLFSSKEPLKWLE
ncbi:hypothetical protein [Candidatus Venteria ishoeyi]|uniref:Uncharacterized protein n=1 Tax=Candidatus Venteria ishoeyi TaxID=1899563 RepID=A0A1H6FIH5_9GAMM|nr:hypothetical protein [Candidatus Venteria ishoeyi]MDM8547412.1 hypothetical protein [Candidatus Venteria ishoeyi]SEH08814.1 Uncharacterised protein [Candidatus Venteria ishoeyi]